MMKFPKPRVLPFTMCAMCALLALKSVALVRAATPDPPPVHALPASPPPASPPPASPPPPSPPPVPQLAAAAQPTAGPPPISDSERALLLDLRARRASLDEREARIAAREQMLAAAATRLSARLDQLTALQAKLQQLEDNRKQRDEANWAGLVKTYETMKPTDAAGIFNDLDMAILLPVMDRMKESKAASILAAMDPAKARLVTTNIAQARLHANNLGS